MKKNNMLRRWKSLSVACLMACSLAFAGAAGAHADAAKAPWETGAPTNGSLTIKKLKDGVNPETPVAGAEFTVKKVTNAGKQPAPNLKTQKGWKELAKKVDAYNAGTDTPNLTDDKKMKTSAQGEAKFENLEIGIYQVTESKVPAGYSSDVKPFYITIPQITGTNSNTTKYEYDVTVKPKNKDVTSLIKKTADTSKTVVAGDDISYTIEAGVNKNKAGNNNVDLTKDDLMGYAVFDDAPKDAFDNISADNVKKVMIGDTQLTKETDYTVEKTENPNNDAKSTRLTVKFNDAGLTKIAQKVNADSSAKVTVNLTFTVKSSITVNEFTNKSGFVPGHGKDEPQSPEVVPTKPDGGEDPNPKTVLRNFQIKKVSAKSSTTVLQGAKFKLFSDKTEAEKCAKDTTQCSDASKFGEKSTDAQGMTEKVKAIVGQEFYVVETEAPENYARSNEVTKVKILENKADDPYVVKIENIPTADSGLWFNLPKTGATGVIIFALAGLALVAAGTAAYLRGRQS